MTKIINSTTHYHLDKHFFDNVILENGGLPHVLHLAAEHYKSLLLYELFYSRPPLCLNVMGGGWWPIGFYLEIAQSPNTLPLFYLTFSLAVLELGVWGLGLSMKSENRKEHKT